MRLLKNAISLLMLIVWSLVWYPVTILGFLATAAQMAWLIGVREYDSFIATMVDWSE